MKRSRLFTAICLAAATLLTACTQDELAEQGSPLPEGQYPLQIGSVSIIAESNAEPWGAEKPQTRVTDSGNTSLWKDGDRIGVCIGESEETGIYVIHANADGTVTSITPETPVYWKSTLPAIITAWYPVDNEIDFTNQDQGLTYLLKGTSDANASYNTSATLTFAHQLAKVRVMLDGDRANAVSAVTVRSYPKSINDQGDLGATTGGDAIYVPMLNTTYNNQPCWEATLRDGTLQADASFRLIPAGGGDPVQAELDNAISISAGNVYNITITTKPYPDGATEIDLGSRAQTITNGTGNYVVKSGNYSNALTISGGSPHIYLDNASISVTGTSAVSITGNANATIHVAGDCTTSKTTADSGAGIYVAEGSTVKIVGGSKSDKLTANAAIYGSGIGGYENSDGSYVNCGNIEISNVTIEARGRGYMGRSPGIGGTGTATCGNIKITNATVYAYGYGSETGGPPAIGAGMNSMTGELGPVPSITISNSEIHAYRGGGSSNSYADWIGSSGSTSSRQSGYAEGVNITNTVVHQYWYGTNTYAEGSSSFDENGDRTEQSQ